MILIDIAVFLEHVQVIRSNIRPKSVQKCRDVQNKPIWANFRKKARGTPLGPFFQTPPYFFETEDSIFKTFYKYYTFNIFKISIKDFFLYFNKYKILEIWLYF
jgi:hypothetical protein